MSDDISILLIDGNHHDRDLYARRLQASSSNYDIAHAATGQAGLDHCVVLSASSPREEKEV